jgi:agmatinase
VLKILEGVAKEGLAGMEVVEVSPPYDSADITSLLAARSMVDVIAAMAKHGRIGGRLKI